MSDLQEKRSPEEMRNKILGLEAAMMAMKEHHIELPLKHYFANGLYVREMFIPKGATLTGMVHKTEHMCIISQGEVKVWTGGDQSEHLKASHVLVAKPGAKRAIHALEDTIWINIHHNPSNETDLDKIEDIFVADTFEEALGFSEKKSIEGGS